MDMQFKGNGELTLDLDISKNDELICTVGKDNFIKFINL